MSQPKVSVIIPAFNLEGYIDKCLESVCSQTISVEKEQSHIRDVIPMISWQPVRSKGAFEDRLLSYVERRIAASWSVWPRKQ